MIILILKCFMPLLFLKCALCKIVQHTNYSNHCLEVSFSLDSISISKWSLIREVLEKTRWNILGTVCPTKNSQRAKRKTIIYQPWGRKRFIQSLNSMLSSPSLSTPVPLNPPSLSPQIRKERDIRTYGWH